MPYHHRIKVEVEGTKSTHYSGGEFEGRRGRITACTVLFGVGEARSFPTRFLSPVHPTEIQEEVLVAGGAHKGKIMVVRERDDDIFTVSTKEMPGQVWEIRKEYLVSLHDEQS